MASPVQTPVWTRPSHLSCIKRACRERGADFFENLRERWGAAPASRPRDISKAKTVWDLVAFAAIHEVHEG
jgi:hypothetical protein